MTKKRIEYIDFLKFTALTGIILAHVGAPDWLMMLRSFDVPLMVILSSLLASHSIQKYNHDRRSILRYYSSRFKRLVFPTWIFLIFYFIFRILFTKEILDVKFYLYTFLLTRYGFGYVWIILIYLYSAFLIPLYRKIGSDKVSILVIISIYAIYELLYYFKIGADNKIIDTTVFYIIPYGLLTFIGYNFEKFSNKKKTVLICVSFIVFVSLAYYYFRKTGSFQLVQIAKYPPRLYYLSYGLLCSLTLMLVCSKYKLKIFNNKIIRFIAEHSMWIYLWHILMLDIYALLKLPELWYIKLPFVYFSAMIIVAASNKIMDLIEKEHKLKVLKYLRG